MSKKVVLIIVGVILVCICIIFAIAAGLSIFGINRVETSLNDTQRKSVALDMNVAIVDYYIEKGQYPAKLEIKGNSLNIPDGRSSSALLDESLQKDADKIFCYKANSDKSDYALGAKMNDGSWYNLGNGTMECDDKDLIK